MFSKIFVIVTDPNWWFLHCNSCDLCFSLFQLDCVDCFIVLLLLLLHLLLIVTGNHHHHNNNFQNKKTFTDCLASVLIITHFFKWKLIIFFNFFKKFSISFKTTERKNNTHTHFALLCFLLKRINWLLFWFVCVCGC